MKVLIVEDETSAYENLKAILLDLYPDIEIAGNTQSVAKTAEWLQEHGQPDLLFMDIHLSDDSAFALFERMEVDTPVIFTTAYDQYAGSTVPTYPDTSPDSQNFRLPSGVRSEYLSRIVIS